MLGGVLPSPAWADKSGTPQQLVLPQADRDWLAAHPVVRIGVDTSYGPYSFLDEQGKLQGIVREFLAYLGPALGVRFEVVTDLGWPRLMAAIQERRIDMVATVVHLPEREAFLEFTAIYLPTPLVIMTRDDTPQLHSIDDLARMSLVLVEGYSSSKEVMEQYPALHPRYVAAPLEALKAVASGATDATVGALGVSTYLAAQHGFTNLKVNAAFDMKMNGQRFGVRKDWPQLARILDHALVAMPAQRKNEILQTWMPGHADNIQRLSQPTLVSRLFPWLAGVTGLAVLGYLVVLLWNRQLRHELARRRVELERAQRIAHLGDWSMDVAGNRIQCSDEIFRMAGRSPCELDWPTLRRWIHPEEWDAHEHYLSQLAALTEGESLPPLVSHLLRPDGSSCWLEISGTAEFDRMGKPCRYVGTALDITERKTQETELKRLHSILNALVEGSTDAIFVKDREGRYLVVNQAMATVIDRPKAAIIGANDSTLFAADSAEHFRADDQRIMQTDAAHSYEEAVTIHNATHHYLTTKGPLIIDGEVRGVFGLARDITERKRVEAALLESESRLRLFIEHAPAALAMFDREMRYLAFSTRWLSDFELESDILGRSHYEIFPEIPERWKVIHHRGLGGEVVRSNEDQFEREDGCMTWLRWEVRPWIAADGSVGGICIFSEDITENKNAEAELRRQKDLLAHTGRLAKVGGWEIVVATMQYSMTDEVFRIFDLEPDPQLTEAPFIACLSEPDQRRLEQAQQVAIERAQPYELELELTTPKGMKKWIHIVGMPVLEAGLVVRLEGAVQDITERKQVEARARRSQLVLDSVFQALPDLFFLMDANGTIHDYRTRQSSALYTPAEVFLGKRMQDVLPPELGASFGNKIAEIGKRGGLITFEYDLLMPDGTQHFEARLTQLPGSTQLIAVVRDITRQYQDHLALGDSESRYRHLFERNPAPMLVYELASLNLLAVNEAFMRHYGYSRDEALALQLPDLYPEGEKLSIIDLAAQLVGLAYVGEWHHLKKDGSQITIEARSHDLQYEGRAARVAVITDITERKQAEQVLRDSEARYRSLLELAPFPAVLTRVRDGILLYGNQRAEIQYGISRENGIGQPAERFYEDRSQRERFLEPLQQTGRVNDLEVRMRTADGHPFWALVSASVVEFENEPAIFTAINDITARKQVEAALQEQETFFRLIAENMGDMVAVLDLEGRRLYNSPSYQALFGDPEALMGTDSFAEIHPEDRDSVREVFMETVRTGHGHRINFRFVLPDGQVRFMESQGGVIRGADDRVERVVVVSRDITERRQMEDEIRQLNTELEERVRQRTAELANANKELETFTYSVSHDLKAPLRGIDGYSRLLLEDYQERLDQAGVQLVNNVRNGVAQMSQLIEDLLAYSRMERRSLLGQTLDLPQVVAKVLGEMQAEIQQHGMMVNASLQGLTVRADPEGLAVVLRNLIDNAIKFSRDSHPPTLSISGVAGEKSITLIVRDNGIGFDMQFHDRIFEIFQRLQRAEEYPGTGVGLAIVCKAMQRMGGDVRAESEPGKGATFYLELPR
jgi:PAS domain S-box-containing protein